LEGFHSSHLGVVGGGGLVDAKPLDPVAMMRRNPQ